MRVQMTECGMEFIPPWICYFGGGSSAPAAPDPYATAQAQGAANVETAKEQAKLNQYNQVTPYGNLTWSNPGSDAGDNTATVTLSPDQQAVLDQNTKASLGLGTSINSALGQVQDNITGQTVAAPDLSQYTTPTWDSDNVKNIQDALYKSYTDLNAPAQQQAQQKLQDQLAAQGIMPGSAAYQTAQDNLNRQQTYQNQQAQSSAVSNATQQGATENATALNDYNAQIAKAQQGFSNSLQTQDQLLNALASLRSGSQVSNPSFMPENASSNVATTPLSQDVYSSYYGNLQNAANNQTNYGGLLGGLGGLAGGGASLYTAFSDRRLKRNIRRVGSLKGLPLYTYNYLWDKTPHIGFMADEVSRVFPDAVLTLPTPISMVDYSKIGRV